MHEVNRLLLGGIEFDDWFGSHVSWFWEVGTPFEERACDLQMIPSPFATPTAGRSAPCLISQD